MLNPSDMTPSTRDLMQFISPNPSDQEIIYRIKSQDIQKYQSQFETWEDENICALLIDYHNENAEFNIQSIVDKLECPILIYQTIKTENDIYQTRNNGYHGVISTLEHLSADDFKDLYKQAESVHFRLIPTITKNQDWEKVIPSHAQFIYIDENSAIEVPKEVEQSRTWLMGSESLKDKLNLKCIIKNPNPLLI